MLDAKPKWFSWYLIKFLAEEVLISFFTGTVIFLLIMLMFQVIRLSDFFVVHQVPIKEVAKLSAFMEMSFVPIAVPIAFLFAVLMGISRANSEGEILALQVNGISLEQIFAPLLAFSVFITIACTLLAFTVVPKGNRAFELLITKLSNERVISSMKPGVFTEGFHDLVLLAEQIVPVKNEMKKVFIYDNRDEAHPLAITAQAGILRNEPENELLTLRLSNGTIYVEKKKAGGIQQKMDFDVYDINLENAARGSGWRDYSPPSYGYDQLNQRINETVHDLPRHRQLKVELHRRFSLAFSCIIFAGLGFFIGIMTQRGIRSTAIVFCMLVGLVYWLSIVGANALAMSGYVPPWAGVWAPNVFFGALSYYLYRRKTAV